MVRDQLLRIYGLGVWACVCVCVFMGECVCVCVFRKEVWKQLPKCCDWREKDCFPNPKYF